MSARAILVTLEYKIKEDAKTDAYRIYLARATQILTENTANAFGGKSMSMSYEELINPKPVDNRSADEIIDGIRKKINS